ncbi:alpha/beta hydrolase family protein [Actinacidiphila glaucinigra]|uniref:alpha/beta hydrolase family protein n=1 Tax=Actinacidiphila glaucinigra TaxID=235986 RepID=UPI0029BC6B15|nr:alpha/beta hydrolase [Streptomyces sp. PA03-3a]
MSVIELTTFVVAPDRTSEMLSARSGMLSAFRKDRRGFVAARLVRVADDTWLDIVEWTDALAFDESRAKGANLPEIAAFFATVDELVSAENGVRYDDAADGLRAVRTIAYGPEPSQVGELYLPEGDGPFPVVVLVHGGWWTAMFDRRQVVPLAEDLVSRGFAVWNVEYRRIGEPGGGWPGTFDDMAATVDAVAHLDPAVDTARVLVVGHSAGGHLAAWVAHRSAQPDGLPGARPKVEPIGVVSLAGVLDLVDADSVALGDGLTDPDPDIPPNVPPPSHAEAWPAVAERAGDGITRLLLGGSVAEHTDRYAAASPVELAAGGVPVPVLIVHGSADEVIPPAYAQTYAQAAAAKGADVTLVVSPGADHFDVIDPDGHAWGVTRAWLDERLRLWRSSGA